MGRKSEKSLKRKHSMNDTVDADLERKQNKIKNNNKNNNNNGDNKSTWKREKKKGGRNYNKNRSNSNSNKNKQVWVDRCITNKPPKDPLKFSGIIKVQVTGVDLSDDHTHGGFKNRFVDADDANDTAIGANIKSSSSDGCKLNEGVALGHTKEEEKEEGGGGGGGGGGGESNSEDLEKSIHVDSNAKNNNKVDKSKFGVRVHLDKSGSVEDAGVEANINNGSGESKKNNEESKDMHNENISSTTTTTTSSFSEQQKEEEVHLHAAVESDHSKQNEEKSLQPYVNILRSKSASMKKNFGRNNSYIDLPNGDCGDGIVNPFPKDEVDDKYWAQRKRFFSKFDDGIQLDKESWYSVTPEAIAIHVAKRMVEDIALLSKTNEKDHQGGAIIVEAFCGCGGNAIGLARMKPSDVQLVLCIDIDRSKLEMAANNASIYGIEPNRMLFIEADSTMILRKYYKNGELLTVPNDNNEKEAVKEETVKGFKIGGTDLLPPRLDAVFMSPPWGGMNYINTGKKGYLIQSISLRSSDDGITVDGEDLLQIARNACKLKFVVYFLPRNINGHELGKSAWRIGYREIEIEKNVLNGKLKTVTVYLRK